MSNTMGAEASGAQFVSLLEQKQLLPPKLIASLNAQIASAGKPVRATAIAKLLVDKGQLTAFQAKQLLAEAAPAAPETSAPEKSAPAKSAPTKPPTPADDDDLGLAPLEDDPKPKSPATSAASDADLGLDDDDDLGLADEPEAKPAAKQPPEKPATKRPAAAAPPSLLDEEFGALDDDLGGLEEDLGGDDLGSGGLDDLLDDPLLDQSSAAASPLMPAKKKKGLGGLFGKKKSAPQKRAPGKSQYDTPLLLVGGGALVLLLLAGAALFYFYSRDSGDQVFIAAEQDYKDGALQQAIHKYNAFLEDYSDHPEASLARVRLWMARLRQATVSGGDPSEALRLAKEAIDEIQEEENFVDARAELGALLPQIAEGLAEQAQQATDTETIRQRVTETEEALLLASNTRYVPTELRDETRLERIRGMLSLVSRDMARDAELESTLESIDNAITAGNTAAAYDLRKTLLKTYPDLESSQPLLTAVRKIAAAERDSIEVASELVAADTADIASPLVAELALGWRRGPSASGASQSVVFVRAAGAVYGLKSEDGSLLWRRFAGYDVFAWPLAADGDAIYSDSSRKELVRVAGASGEVVWRAAIGEAFAQPVLAAGNVLVATESGKLWQIDAGSGASARRAELSQTLPTAPAFDDRSGSIFLAGDHSNLYALAADDLSARGVLYVGHQAGTVDVPPVVLLNYVLLAENWGAANASLHVVALDEAGVPTEVVQTIRLDGHVVTPPVTSGRRVILATDRGLIKVFEVTSSPTDGAPLIQVAERVASGGEPLAQHLLIEGDNLWVADNQLSRFVVQTSTGRLVTQPVANPEKGAVFDAPLRLVGNLVLHTRRRPNAASLTAAVVDVGSGERRWQNDLAATPAGAPIVDAGRRQIATVSQNGAAYLLDAAAIRARVQDNPAVAPSETPTAILTAQVALADGPIVFTPAAGEGSLLVFDPAAGTGKTLPLPSGLACPPVALDAGVVTATPEGRVRWIDPRTGKDKVTPFQPRLEPGQTIDWRTPGVVQGKSEVVVSDGAFNVYRLAIAAEPSPHLEAVASSPRLVEEITSPVAVLGEMALAATSGGKLIGLQLEDLQPTTEIDLTGQAVWGPYRVGELALVINDRDELLAIDAAGKLAWRVELEHPDLAGWPQAEDGQLLLCSVDGIVWRIDAASGKTLARLDLGQPVASGAVAFGPRRVVAAADGTLLVFDPPQGD